MRANYPLPSNTPEYGESGDPTLSHKFRKHQGMVVEVLDLRGGLLEELHFTSEADALAYISYVNCEHHNISFRIHNINFGYRVS